MLVEFELQWKIFSEMTTELLFYVDISNWTLTPCFLSAAQFAIDILCLFCIMTHHRGLAHLSSHFDRPDKQTKWDSANITHWGRDKIAAISQTTIIMSQKFVPKSPINNIPALVQIMAWRRSGDMPLYESMMISLPTHIFVTRPQLS